MTEQTSGDALGDAAGTSGHTKAHDTGVDFTTEALTFDAFFIAHHADLVRALSITLGDQELGRDAAAEGFARAMPRWNKVSAYANPAGWVYRVGLNWARSRRRKTMREVAEQPADNAVEPNEPDYALTTALRSLSVDHRAVVVGRFYLDWSEAQLAIALDISPGTVKSRLSRALARLAETLETSHGTN